MLILAVFQIASACLAAGEVADRVEFRSYGPGSLGTGGQQPVRVEAFVPATPRLVPNSIQLFSWEEGDRARRDSDDPDLASHEKPLCTLFDNGDSRNGDDKAADDVYSCIAMVHPRYVGRLHLIIQAKFGNLVRGKHQRIQVLHTQEAVINVVNGQVKAEVESESDRDQILESSRKIWQRMRAKFGLTDRAQAETVRAIKELDGVKDARLNTSGDVLVYFAVGGHDQIFTFQPRH